MTNRMINLFALIFIAFLSLAIGGCAPEECDPEVQDCVEGYGDDDNGFDEDFFVTIEASTPWDWDSAPFYNNGEIVTEGKDVSFDVYHADYAIGFATEGTRCVGKRGSFTEADNGQVRTFDFEAKGQCALDFSLDCDNGFIVLTEYSEDKDGESIVALFFHTWWKAVITNNHFEVDDGEYLVNGEISPDLSEITFIQSDSKDKDKVHDYTCVPS